MLAKSRSLLTSPRERIKAQVFKPSEIHKKFIVKNPDINDISSLRELEVLKWDKEGADVETLIKRIQNTPSHSWLVYDKNNKAVASLFVMAKSKHEILNCKDWFETTNQGYAHSHNPSEKSWFGISSSSLDSDASNLLFIEAIVKILRDGIQSVFLGSPLPGYSRWKKNNPKKNISDYMEIQLKNNKPSSSTDPLLYYYMQLGFQVVQIKEEYFPSEKSMNYGVLIEYKNNLHKFSYLFRIIPEFILRKLILKLIAIIEPI